MARKHHNQEETIMEHIDHADPVQQAEDVQAEDVQAEDVQAEDETPTAVEGGYQVIKIAGRPFSIRAPYSVSFLRDMDDGHLAIMANALNSLRGENVRNNVAAVMKALAEKKERQMTEAEVASYDETYDIGNRRTRSGAVQYDPIGKEERRLAALVVDTKLRAHAVSRGLSFKEFRAALSKDSHSGYVTKAVDTGKFRAQAERNVAERTAEANIELDFNT